jgi:sigma-B regulation protein RsbU (phosphoserine phosphatase)
MKAAAATPAPLHDLGSFLLEISDAVNSTLDLEQVLNGVAEIVKRVLDYDVFAILLLNERTSELRVRFAVGHVPEVVERLRVKLGSGITGVAAATQEPQLVNDVAADPRYIHALDGIRAELAIPIVFNRRVIGVIDLQARELNAFSNEHRTALTLVAGRVANAIENARLYRNAITRERTLELLADISREISSILSLDELLKRTAEMVKRVIDYHLFSILLLKDERLELRVSVKGGENVNVRRDVPLGAGIVGAAIKARAPVVVRDVTQDSRYICMNPDVRSELAVPLIHQDEVIGVLDVEHTRRGYFTEVHARTLATLAAQMAVAIANARLYEKVAAAENRMERDLNLARRVQRHLLPPHCPVLPGLEIAAHTIPARELGGDLYDFIPQKSNRMAIAVGDVSGKGAGAALYGALVMGILRSQAPHHLSPAELLNAVNAGLLERRVEAQFMTLTYALWSERSHRLTIANSGLPYPVLCTGNGVRLIRAAGIPLGMLDRVQYDEVTVTLAPEDVVVFVSDGITEHMNAEGQEYGRARLETALQLTRERSAGDIVKSIFADAEAFAGGIPAADDRTVVVVKAR